MKFFATLGVILPTCIAALRADRNGYRICPHSHRIFFTQATSAWGSM
jgi:hypothetical protein